MPEPERFTERARNVGVLAQEEAGALKHNYIGTEHILLGLLREEEGLAAQVLKNLGITIKQVRTQVMRIVGLGEEAIPGQPSLTPRASKVFELALREALSLGHSYIDTEHILLGLVREDRGVAARILLDFDADQYKIRQEVIRMLSGPGGRRTSADRPSAIQVTPAEITVRAAIDELDRAIDGLEETGEQPSLRVLEDLQVLLDVPAAVLKLLVARARATRLKS